LLHEIENEPEAISAVMVEPVMTARGYIFPPAEYMQRLRHCTQKHGILMIADEIQAGLGRCGAIVQSRAQAWQPDLLVFGKSLGGGIVPISVVIGRADILDSIPAGAESETAAASPLSCAVARRVLELLHEEPLIEAGSRAGQHLRQHLVSVLADFDWPIRVEGRAATCVIECAASQTPISEAQEWARRIASACVRRRLRVQLSGPHATRIVMLPPLTIQTNELQLACERLQEAVQDVAAC
jgi:4-aminobutyrate aminotransferase-like enzyme